jgi:hypothetical protein
MLQTLSKLFRLKPYGNNLIDGIAELWLVLAALNIAAIALCDAVAWAYFGYTTAHGWVAYLTAAVAGLIVLTLVGSLDAMFVMHDRSRPERPAEEKPSGFWQTLRRSIHRDHAALGARIVLVILTFTVTAPFLTQLFFARDIEATIKRRNEQVIAARRAAIIAAFDKRMNTARDQLAGRQRDLEKEIAGSGASGRYGRGPTAAAIQREIDAAQTELAVLDRAKGNEIRFFDHATSVPEVLASRYGVDLVREGPNTRARVIAALEQSPSFRATRTTIKAFLVFMFLGLVCLKLFQPESVRIYYSGRMQAAYARLKAGIFNNRIDPRELPDAGGMTPLRFADWYDNDQQVRDLAERMNMQENAVRVLQETLRLDIARMRDDLAATSKASDDLEQQMVTSRHELNVLDAKIAEAQQQLDDFRYDFDEVSLRDQQLLIGSRNKTARHLAEHRAAAAGLTASLQRLQNRLEVNRAYESQLRESLDAAGHEAAKLTTAVQKARQRRVADILRAT